MRNIKIAVVSVIALAAILVVRYKVGENYRKGQLQLKEYNAQAEKLKQLQQTAAQQEAEVDALRKAVAANPNDIKARWLFADKLQQLHRGIEMHDQLAEIVARRPHDRAALLALANASLALLKVQDAEKQYKALTKEDPKNAEAWEGYAAALYRQRKYREAGRTASVAVSLSPNNWGSRYLLASAALEFGIQFSGHVVSEPLTIARVNFERLAKEQPDSGDVYYKLGRVFHHQQNEKLAAENLRKAHELLPDRKDITADYIQVLLNLGDRATARPILEAEVAKGTKSADIYHILSDVLQSDGTPPALQKAVDASKKAVELAPTKPDYYDRLGTAYIRLNDLQGARKAFESSLLLDANRANPYQQLAAIYARLGDRVRSNSAAKMATRMVANDQLLRQLEEVSNQYPEDTKLLILRGDRYRDLKNFSAARDMYEIVQQLEPNNAKAKAGLAFLDKAEKKVDHK